MLPVACVLAIVALSSSVQGQNPRRPNPCRNFKCLNGGTCQFPADAPICVCPAGFFGDRCQFNRDPCFNFRCMNGGRCTAPADAPYCECPKGYTGNKCQFKDSRSGSCPVISPGSVGICGGIFCSDDNGCVGTGEKCCPSACGGKLCTKVSASVNRDPCFNYLCMNGGSCTAPADAPNCECPKGYTGNKCQFIDSQSDSCPVISPGSFGVCGGIFCSDDIDCVNTGEKCCPSECGGKLCTKVSAPVNRDPCFDFLCMNGGRCTAPADAPYCECPKGYTGNKCQFKDSQSDSCPVMYICGGIFCFDDIDCIDTGEKCCPSECGGKLCTKVNDSADVTSLCEHKPCDRTKVCRVVKTQENQIPEGQCVLVHLLNQGLDQVCRQQNFLHAVLTPSKLYPSIMNSLECSTSGYSGECPTGSVCVMSQRGHGHCCYKTTDPKPGTCPMPGGTGVCGGTSCNVDEECLGDEKCCESSCGAKICTIPAPTYTGCPEECDPGYTCQMVKSDCPVGSICSQVLVPKCVPLVDNCDVCSPGTTCIDTGIRCITYPCPSFVCASGVALNDPPKPIDECGGCPDGQICKPTDIVCKKAPCPSHSCVPVDPAPVCNFFCISGYRCVVRPMGCPAKNPNCGNPSVPQCVPIELATCPKPAQYAGPTVCPAVINKCQNDSECSFSQFERCCPDACNFQQCTQVPVA